MPFKSPSRAVLVFILTSLLAPSLMAAEGPDTSATVWNLGSLEVGKRYPTSITATNVSCRGRHDFRVEIVDTPWLQLGGSDTLQRIAVGQSKSVKALVDTGTLSVGPHHGRVRVVCLNCPPPPACTQNIVDIDVQMTIGTITPAPPQSIKFAEEETSVSEALAKELGYRSLTVLPGEYVVRFDDGRPFGSVRLDVAGEKDPQAITPNPGRFGLRIRIASRRCHCLCGIGFLCGLVGAPPSIDVDTYSITMQVLDNRQLEITLKEQVPWDLLANRPHQETTPPGDAKAAPLNCSNSGGCSIQATNGGIVRNCSVEEATP